MTADPVPAWMVETARLDERLKAQALAAEVALANLDKAIIKAETATEKRFEGVNEFRAALADQTATFVTRADLNAAIGRAVAVASVAVAIIMAVTG